MVKVFCIPNRDAVVYPQSPIVVHPAEPLHLEWTCSPLPASTSQKYGSYIRRRLRQQRRRPGQPSLATRVPRGCAGSCNYASPPAAGSQNSSAERGRRLKASSASCFCRFIDRRRRRPLTLTAAGR